jgi:hypothetical protein
MGDDIGGNDCQSALITTPVRIREFPATFR